MSIVGSRSQRYSQYAHVQSRTRSSPPCVVRASSACLALARIARHAAGPTRPGVAAREARSTRRRTTKQRIHSQHVPSRSSPVPVCAASACPLPAWVARHAADTTRPVLAARVTSKGHRRMIRQRAQHGHQASGREDDARRRREERVSTGHDGADGREPRTGKLGDVLMILVTASRYRAPGGRGATGARDWLRRAARGCMGRALGLVWPSWCGRGCPARLPATAAARPRSTAQNRGKIGDCGTELN